MSCRTRCYKLIPFDNLLADEFYKAAEKENLELYKVKILKEAPSNLPTEAFYDIYDCWLYYVVPFYKHKEKAIEFTSFNAENSSLFFLELIWNLGGSYLIGEAIEFSFYRRKTLRYSLLS